MKRAKKDAPWLFKGGNRDRGAITNANGGGGDTSSSVTSTTGRASSGGSDETERAYRPG